LRDYYYWNNWKYSKEYKEQKKITDLNKIATNLAEMSKQLSLVSLDLDKLLDILINEMKEIKGGEEE
tara:strand:+ start:108 stop:308 length:201 start_codon:yes stop_codon:yes gene_type:complete